VPAKQIPLELPHRPALERADLFVTLGNQDAVSWIDRWPGWPGYALAIYGPIGCGKTHLLQVFAVLTEAFVITEADLDSIDLVAVAESNKAIAFERGFGALNEEALFHLLNAVREAKGHILIVGREPPARWNISLDDLDSRLRAITAIKIQPPDDTTLKAVLEKLFRDRQLIISTDVLDYAITRMPRTFSDCHTLVNHLDREALAQSRRITIPLVRTVLEHSDFFSGNKPPV